ncbi:MAG: hypothetical protein D6812_12485 [Deltaproteobacteria bacterium]|nr:MAG: hypothetical protein D6812_12485 [Deltaproteobacteria bacterium]
MKVKRTTISPLKRIGVWGGLFLFLPLLFVGCGGGDATVEETAATTEEALPPTALEISVNYSDPDVRLEGFDPQLQITLFEYRPGQASDELTGESENPLMLPFTDLFEPTRIYRIEDVPVGVRMVVVAELQVVDEEKNRTTFARGHTIVDALREGETFRLPAPIAADLLPLAVTEQYKAVIYLLPNISFQDILNAVLQILGGGGNTPPPQGDIGQIADAVEVLVEFLQSIRMNTIFTFLDFESDPSILRGELCVDSFLVTDPTSGASTAIPAPIGITGEFSGSLEDLVAFSTGKFQQPATFSTVIFNINTAEIVDLFFSILIDTLSSSGSNDQLIAILEQLQTLLAGLVPDIPLPPLEGAATAQTRDTADFVADEFIDGSLWTTITFTQLGEPVDVELTFTATNQFALKPDSPCK